VRKGMGFSRGPRDFNTPKPVEVGKEYEVEITEKGSKGDGIARIQGFVVFVSGGNPGDKVKIKITSVANRFAQAEVVK
jgi:predicted RNA-binding protein with TRAM domain